MVNPVCSIQYVTCAYHKMASNSNVSLTPSKLSFKTIENLHTVCICCCTNISFGDGKTGRRLANGYRQAICDCDIDYTFIFNPGAPVYLYICCVF